MTRPLLYGITLNHSNNDCIYHSANYLRTSTLSITSSAFSFSIPKPIMGTWEGSLLVVANSLLPLCGDCPLLLLSLSYRFSLILSKSRLLLIPGTRFLNATFCKSSCSSEVSGGNVDGSRFVCLFVFWMDVPTGYLMADFMPPPMTPNLALLTSWWSQSSKSRI